MRFQRIQDIIDILRGKHYKNYKISKLYGKIYYPIYNYNYPITPKNYDLFDKNGNKLEIFFLRDTHAAHYYKKPSKYFIWDRYDFTLDTHFYSGMHIVEPMGKPKRRYGYLPESEAIVPNEYKIFDKFKGIEKDYDLIFTYSEKLLNKLDNAVFIPFCSSVWGFSLRSADNGAEKYKNVSILSSDKLLCDLHKYRFELAKKCKRENLADTFGTFDGGPIVNISHTLKNYRYSICIENDIKPYFFTERILSAFAYKTVPIYIGATEIDKFFNADGIIKLKPTDDIEKVLKQCSEKDYEQRLPAIENNYKKALSYGKWYDFIYENYLSNKMNSTKEGIEEFINKINKRTLFN